MLARQDYINGCIQCGQTIYTGTEFTWIRRDKTGTPVSGKYLHVPTCSNEYFGRVENQGTEIEIETEHEAYQVPKPPQETTHTHGVSNKVIAALQDLIAEVSQNALDEQRVLELIAQNKISLTDEDITAIAKRISDNTQTVSLKVLRPDGTEKKFDIVHKQFKKLLLICALRDSKISNVYLYGMPSSGKSTVGNQIAEALSLPYYFISLTRQSVPSLLMGYMDATGKYIETAFYRWYKFGGIFMIDEKDNASGNLLTALNSALDNGHCAFPNGEIVQRHPDAILIASGNTNGNGANKLFPDRCVMDSAEKNRYTFFEWEFDYAMETAIALKLASDYGVDNETAMEWVKYFQDLRDYCKERHPEFLVSQRSTYKAIILWALPEFSSAEILELSLWYGASKQFKQDLLTAKPLPFNLTRRGEN